MEKVELQDMQPSTSRGTINDNFPRTTDDESKLQPARTDDILNQGTIRNQDDEDERSLSECRAAAENLQQPTSSGDPPRRPSRHRGWFDWYYLPEQTPVILFIYSYGHILSFMVLLFTTSVLFKFENIMTLYFLYLFHMVGTGLSLMAMHGYVQKKELWSWLLQCYIMFMQLSLVFSFFLLVTCDKNDLLDAYRTRPFYNMKLSEYVPLFHRGKTNNSFETEPMNEIAVQHFRSCFLICTVFLFNLYVYVATVWGFKERLAENNSN